MEESKGKGGQERFSSCGSGLSLIAKGGRFGTTAADKKN